MIFSDDMLNLCWNYIVYKENENALNNELWKVIIKSCTEVIESNDSNNWYWLKQYMLKSTIWLETDPMKGIDDDNKEEIHYLIANRLYLI